MSQNRNRIIDTILIRYSIYDVDILPKRNVSIYCFARFSYRRGVRPSHLWSRSNRCTL